MTAIKLVAFRSLGLTMGLCLSLALLLTNQASAAVINSIPGGTMVAMPTLEYFGGGPQLFGPGITWTSTNTTIQGGSAFGYTGGYGFGGIGGNGGWNNTLGPMAGVNSSFYNYNVSHTMTFAFSSPLSAVGGFLNYDPSGSTPTTIAVYDSGFNLIESFNLTFMTGGGTNTGSFLGFQAASNIISYFTLSDNYIGLTDLTILSSVAAVPEPSSSAFAGLGAIGLVAGAIRRRRQARTAT